MRTPATIVTGFLGSGKTTIIAHLLDDLSSRGEKCVYIKNEIGDSSTDALLLKSMGSNIGGVRELTNGCICCTLTGQMYHAVNELIDTYHPDRIIMESAGTAKPHDLALAVSEHPQLLRDGVVCIIDVLNFNGYDRVDSVAQKQAEFTDLLIFNKIELVPEERLHTVVGYVREVSPSAPIIEAPNGRAPVDVLCGIASTLQLSKTHDHHHEADDNIQAITIEPKEMTLQTYESAIHKLPNSVFRVKGVLTTPDGQVLVNTIYKRTTNEQLSEKTEAKLVFIGYNIAAQEPLLRSLFT